MVVEDTGLEGANVGLWDAQSCKQTLAFCCLVSIKLQLMKSTCMYVRDKRPVFKALTGTGILAVMKLEKKKKGERSLWMGTKPKAAWQVWDVLTF